MYTATCAATVSCLDASTPEQRPPAGGKANARRESGTRGLPDRREAVFDSMVSGFSRAGTARPPARQHGAGDGRTACRGRIILKLRDDDV